MSIDALDGLHGLEPAAPHVAAPYVAHALHRGERVWPESNCYADLWIELLHAWGLEPLAALGFTVRMDLEGDQWTFFKQRHTDLERLFGIEVGELNVWRPLVDHCATEVALGHTVLVEVDAFHLPDTAGVSYRTEHVKTTVGVHEIDVSARRLVYFHNAGRFVLEGDDFDRLFRVPGTGFGAEHLAPYVELAKRTGPALAGAALAEEAVALLQAHLRWVPRTNPVTRYRDRLAAEVESLRAQGPAVAEAFHRYSFANCRQLGANFELAAEHLRWLAAVGPGKRFEVAADPFAAIARDAKALQFKLARAAVAGRALDVGPLLDGLESAWAAGVDHLLVAAG